MPRPARSEYRTNAAPSSTTMRMRKPGRPEPLLVTRRWYTLRAMRILVTGASGFIGRHVAAAARDRGHALRLLTHTADAAGTANGSVESVAHDLRRREGLADIVRGVDAVIHCAALLNGSEHDQQAVTVDGTKNLLDAMAAAGVAHIVLISTFALYDYRRIPAGSA